MTSAVRRGLVVDTSAAVAIILAEPDADELVRCLDRATLRLMSAANRVELGMVIEARLGPDGRDAVDRFLRDAEIDVVGVDPDAAERALGAWRRYGRGRHRAALNFGDCFGYALSEQTGFPVLCTDRDFTSTDIATEPV